MYGYVKNIRILHGILKSCHLCYQAGLRVQESKFSACNRSEHGQKLQCQNWISVLFYPLILKLTWKIRVIYQNGTFKMPRISVWNLFVQCLYTSCLQYSTFKTYLSLTPTQCWETPKFLRYLNSCCIEKEIKWFTFSSDIQHKPHLSTFKTLVIFMKDLQCSKDFFQGL